MKKFVPRLTGRGWLAVAVLLVVATSVGATTIRNVWFNHSNGNYTTSRLNKDFPGYWYEEGVSNTGNRAYIHNNQLKVRFPANQYGNKKSGATWAWKTGGNHDVMTVQYRVKFEKGFGFSRGGKLPGMAGGEKGWEISGGNKANGSNGWSCRLMWRDNGKLSIYAYRANDTGDKYGDDFDAYWPTSGDRVKFTEDKWYTVKVQVRMNTKKNGKWQANGQAKLWVDAGSGFAKVVDKRNIIWRKSDNSKMKANTFWFSSFRGGNDSSWTTGSTKHIWFDSIKITRGT